MMTWLDQHRHSIFIGLLLATLVGLGGFYWRQPTSQPIEILTTDIPPTAPPMLEPSPTPGLVRVYVTGAVLNPDVYILPEGSIIKDAILAAGGLTVEADPERINQALELQDQQQIHVPRVDEEDPPPPVQNGSTPLALSDTTNNSNGGTLAGEIININTATLEELDTLPCIGPVIAQRIIDYRSSSGGFPSVEAITEVSGVGQATFGKIRERITVE